MFFYNPSSRISVWERPEDLVGRQDVEKMIASPPEVAAAPIKSSRQSDSSESSDEEQPTPKKMKHDDNKGECRFVKGIYRR